MKNCVYNLEKSIFKIVSIPQPIYHSVTLEIFNITWMRKSVLGVIIMRLNHLF